ncbi:MAG TPA: mannose-1-phosphate guanyltransferase [Candidatus Ozemobacteraceae bacterium]|nr:mannose-1-phosphate guanyltransferase [Candidatus Ozemobacteraceae bacterium]
MKAVIMAGGFGTRLRPITCNIPKPMVPLANVPMMEHIVNLLKQYDFRKICSILYFQPEVITKYFGDGADFDIEMEYQMATADFGTAGSVKNTEEKLKDEPFIIISGDVLTDFDLAQAIKFHQEKKSMATMVLTRVTNPLEYGVVITAEDGKIVRFLEKPSWGEVFSDTINTGIYILEPEIFKYIPAKTEFDFSKNLFPLMLKEGLPLYGYIAEGYWKDIGNLDEYMLAHQNVLNGEVKLQIPGERLNIIGRDVWVGKNSNISAKVKFKGGVIIGQNCVIEDGVELENCVLGDGCIIKKNARIKGATLWDGVHVGENTRLDEAVISSQTHVEDGAEVENGAIISEECRIGKGAIIRENVKIWPKKQVEEGSTVYTSIIWSDKWTKNLFNDFGIAGLANIEITPEMASKIGAAFGSTLPKESSIIVSRDSHKISRMINRAIICGLSSAGINVADLRVTPAPVARYKPSAFMRGGGVHVKVASDNPNQLEIRIFDVEGRDISVNTKKTIERLFNREDFRRVSINEVGEITFPPRVPENYSEELLRHIDVEAIKERRLKVVIDYAFSGASGIFNTFLGKLNCEVITMNAYHDEAKVLSVKPEHSQASVSSIVKSLGADLGIIMGDGAERITFVDNQGRVILGEEALVTWAKMIFDLNPNARVAVPVSTTHELDKLAAKSGATVIRTKTNARALMDAALNDKVVCSLDENCGIIFPAFQAAFDGIFATVKLLEYIARHKKPLSEIFDSIPEFFARTTRIPCPWEEKGKVMRYAMEFAKDKETRLIDGVKIMLSNDEWVLILPDPDRPFVNVTVESTSEKKVTDLLTKTVARVEEWKNKSE